MGNIAAISIRNLDSQVKERLRVRAAQNGRSMESEVRAILEAAVRKPADGPDLFETLMDICAEIGGVELDIPPRHNQVRAPDLSE